VKSKLAMDALRHTVTKMPTDRLTPVRLAALAQIDEHGLPTTTHEDWKYTDIARLVEISNQWLADGANDSPVSEDAINTITTQFDAAWLIVRNGVVDTRSIDNLALSQVDVKLLTDTETIPSYDAPLSDLNLALLRDGITIQVSADAEEIRTIGMLFIDSAVDEVGVSPTRININMGDNSSANFIEYHASMGHANHYANSVIDIALADNATANYVRIQNRDSLHGQTGRLTATLGNSSQFRHGAFDFGGKLVRNDLDIRLTGRDSSASFCGLYLAGEQQHIDNHTRVDHLVGPARSNQEYRGILAGEARCVWNGKAIVHSGADGTDADQANHNLLLSDSAEIDAKPELEIYADDVKCSHGTTIGQLDASALFYLRTRGLDKPSAQQLLTRAFAQKIVAMSPIESIQKTISEMVADRVEQLIDRSRN
jgi:Fe-S cluster assembly protein SufD